MKKANRQTGTVSRGRVERRAEEIAGRGRTGSARADAPRRSGKSPRSGQTSACPASRSGHLSHTTTDHDEIRRWAKERGAHPAAVRRTGCDSDVGIIRLDFPDYSGGKSMEEIPWDEFFKKSDESNLELVYQEHTASGERSNFNKLVKRD